MKYNGVFSSILAIVISLVLAIVISFFYTSRSIDNYAHQACSQLRIIATSLGATTDYDKAIKKAYQQLYKLQCG